MLTDKNLNVRVSAQYIPSISAGVSLSFCEGGQWGSVAFLVFLMKESKKIRQKQPGKFIAKSRSQPVNLAGAQPLMNSLHQMLKL